MESHTTQKRPEFKTVELDYWLMTETVRSLLEIQRSLIRTQGISDRIFAIGH